MAKIPLSDGQYEIRVGKDATSGEFEIADSQSGTTYTFDPQNAAFPELKLGSAASIANPVGSNLSIDSNGALNATDTDTQPNAHADSGTASGDGTKVTFTLSHSLGVTPSAVNVQPTSADAAGDFYVSGKTSTGVDVTFAAAPASGTGNLTFDLGLIE